MSLTASKKIDAPKLGAKTEHPSQAKSSESKWQALFTKRLPHRIGQPLSSSGGGDGCST